MGVIIDNNIFYKPKIDKVDNGDVTYDFSKSKEELFIKSLSTYGTDINFDDDVWFCDKLITNQTRLKKYYTLYFSRVPEKYKSELKYYCIYRLSASSSTKDVKEKITSITKLLDFIEKEKLDISELNRGAETEFTKYLDSYIKDNGEKLSVSYKSSIFNSSKHFIDFIVSFKGYNSSNSFSIKRNPYKDKIVLNHDYKYIPDNIISQLDEAFKREDIPRTLKVFYWIARSIPSRVSEVLEMSLNCLKPYGDNAYTITIPTRKQTGGYHNAKLRMVTLNYNGHGKFLIDLIKEQIEYSKLIQNKLPEEKKGFLFAYQVQTYNERHFKETGEHTYYPSNRYSVVNTDKVADNLNRFCKRYNIKKEDGSIYSLTSHQLRHNGITERIYAGFTPLQIMLMTEHQNDEMITKSYTHRKEQVLLEKQRAVNGECVSPENTASPILFKGRILNMDDRTEERLLKNLRAHRLKGLGICSDFTKCQNNILACLDNCDNFIPDAENLDYFKEQIEVCDMKIEKFKNNKQLKENIEYNRSLYIKVVRKIETNLIELNNTDKENAI